MVRDSRRPYDPITILLMPRWSNAAVSIQTMYHIIDSVDYAIASASDDDEARQFKSGWSLVDDIPLLVLRPSSSLSCKWSVDAVAQISAAHGGKAVCVFLVDGQDVPGYKAGKRNLWERSFAEQLQRAVLDSQIHQFSDSWATSPPRAR